MTRLVACLGMIISVLPATAQTEPSIRIEPVTAATWRASYTFEDPVTELRFERPAAFYREGTWRVLTPGYRLARRGDDQVLVLEDGGEASRSLTFEFPVYTDVLPKEYELFVAFSDGGLALYTGHFYAIPTMADGAAGVPVRTVEVVPPAGSHAVVRGRVLDGPAAFQDEIGEGTYVYMGEASPIETPHLLAIVDRGMPVWLREQFEQGLPDLFDAYAARLGADLPWKPLVLYSFRGSAGSGYSSGGGTLTGLISMTVEGDAWRTQSDAAATQAFQLLAHESAHLWNGQLVNSPGGAESWLHEGSADAMADALLLSFGIIDRSGYRVLAEQALNRCASELREGPLADAARRGAFRSFYDCGFVVALWTGAALAADDPGDDLFAFWRDLIATALERGGSYDAELYFDLLAARGIPRDVIDSMRMFSTVARSIEPVLGGLSLAGIEVGRGVSDPPPSVEQDLARSAFAHLMGVACGRLDFRAGRTIVTGAVPGCAPFEESLTVYGVQGFRIADQGAALYDAVVAACAAGETVLLEGEHAVPIGAIACTRVLSDRLPWLSLPAGTWPGSR